MHRDLRDSPFQAHGKQLRALLGPAPLLDATPSPSALGAFLINELKHVSWPGEQILCLGHASKAPQSQFSLKGLGPRPESYSPDLCCGGAGAGAPTACLTQGGRGLTQLQAALKP